MTEERTRVGHEIETAREEVLAHVRGEVALLCQVMDAGEAHTAANLAGWPFSDRSRRLRSPSIQPAAPEVLRITALRLKQWGKRAARKRSFPSLSAV